MRPIMSRRLLAVQRTDCRGCSCATEALVGLLFNTQGAVYCVEYASNGQRFASGAADKTVIIWTSKASSKGNHGGASGSGGAAVGGSCCSLS